MLQERREQLHNNLLPILDAILVHALNAIPSCPIVMTRLIIILVIKGMVPAAIWNSGYFFLSAGSRQFVCLGLLSISATDSLSA